MDLESAELSTLALKAFGSSVSPSKAKQAQASQLMSLWSTRRASPILRKNKTTTYEFLLLRYFWVVALFTTVWGQLTELLSTTSAWLWKWPSTSKSQLLPTTVRMKSSLQSSQSSYHPLDGLSEISNSNLRTFMEILWPKTSILRGLFKQKMAKAR